MSTTTTPSSLKIGSLVQLNNEVIKIVSYITQLPGHYITLRLETGRVLKAFTHLQCQYEPVDIATDFLEDSISDISHGSINGTAKKHWMT